LTNIIVGNNPFYSFGG